MSVIKRMFGKSPFAPLAEHAKKVHACVGLVRPLMEAVVREDYEAVHRLQDQVAKTEYEADQIKHEIRDRLPRRHFLPVSREDLDRFLHCQDEIADYAQDFAVVLLLRRTKVHPDLREEFLEFVDQVIKVSDTLMSAAEELVALAETSFSGAESKSILVRISGLGEGEWLADRLERRLSRHIYELEPELDPVTIMFYERMCAALSGIANAAENTGDLLRRMILRGP
jgi:predicted phosphate transport protein (TIGR00153 family)